MDQLPSSRCGVAAIAAAAALAVLAQSSAIAQEPPPPVFPPPPAPVLPPAPVFPAPQQAVPPASVFPQQPEALPAPVPQFGAPLGPAESPKQILKNMFAASLAAMTTTVGTTVLTGLTQAITGGITSWFSRKKKTEPDVATVAQAPAALPPTFDAGAAVAPIPPPPSFAPVAPQFFDAQTGAAAVPDPVFAQALAAPDAGGGVFAGLAFEVHAVLPGGAMTPVNPATHEFRTGDRFIVVYRPTLPGQMTVFNINPAGVQTQIDRVDLAAGQLAQLGPYEFAAMTGDEQLRLVLSPCSTPELLATTRDIVNVANAAPAAPALNLAACSPATRSIRDVPTRDIRKVGVEGTTAFALDPVSASEFSSGQVAPREVTIVFRHR
jgi:hypothetical protein